MSYWLSEAIENLLAAAADSAASLETDVLVVGSGYGAAMATLAILERSSAPAVWVFEAGREYLPDDFPKTMAEMPGFIGTDALNAGALWDIRPGDGVISISARGLGGTSLVNANVAARADPEVFEHWPGNRQIGWHDRLSRVSGKIERLLGVTTYPDHPQSGTLQALTASASALGAQVERAPLSINFDQPGVHSADHGPCNRCGNCVTGCHSGAKGSLNLNAWPLAKQMGAKLYTGVQVRSLRRNEDGSWQVLCSPTGKAGVCFNVRAGTVILAAGTLGSTEILKRSAQEHALPLSNRLGKRFSLNGDALVAAIGQQQRVSDLASVSGEQPPATAPGPTITGLARIALQASEAEKNQPLHDWITVEDAQIPFPLRQIWQEMIVSQALLRRFGDGSESAWHRSHVAHDPLAISDELAAHTQTLLIMGHDDARGELQWHNDRLEPSWQRTEDAYYLALDKRLRAQENRVFDGGLYSPNLISQPLPPGFEDVLEGAAEMQGPLLTVHPLGGCCMGNSADDGVVNTSGQVFTGEADAVYHNLYVLDGAIVPGAVGINPFLTIASLSYVLASDIPISRQRAAMTLVATDSVPALNTREFPALTRYRKIPRGSGTTAPPAQPVQAEFRERLVCHLAQSHRSPLPWSRSAVASPQAIKNLLPGLAFPDTFNALVLDVRFEFAADQALERWIRNPGMALPADAVLSADVSENVFIVPDTHLHSLAHLRGLVRLGITDSAAPGVCKQWWRMLSAVLRFVRFRPMDVLIKLPVWLQKCCLPRSAWALREPALRKKSSRSALAQLKEFLRIARLQSAPRYLHYEFSNDADLRLRGKKVLAYGLDQRDLLAALMVLPVEIESAGVYRGRLQFEMDAVRVTDGPSPLQITASPDLPASVMAAGGFAMYFLRMIMNTHFWSFGAPAYQQFAAREDMETTLRQGRFAEPPEVIFYGAGGKQQSTRREKFEHGDMQSGKLRPLARLVRYQPSDSDNHATRRTLLLVHGLAHSSRVFWTDTLDCNFVQYFLAHNYDVWVLDHRASANYIREINPADRWDDIALVDIPWAVRTIFNQINQLAAPGDEKHVHVFSHCIGAGAVAIAVLAGRLNYEQRLRDGRFVQRSMLASLVPHAVTPWLHASAENRARANVWAWVKELQPLQIIEPLPRRDPTLLEMLYDRLAALAMTADERRQWNSVRGFGDWRGPGFAQSIYTRYTIFWGRQWHNANINRETRQQFAGMIGPVPIGVMQQVYFSMTRGLLSDHEGANSYVREACFEQFWQFPTLFLHGNRNTVFDQESSRHSADQLTRLRIRQATGDSHGDALQPEEYARHQVWIEVLNDYGHMDMIFSKTASNDVYPRLHEFISAAENNSLEHLCRQRMSMPGARDWFAVQCRARSTVVPSRRPRTGPIISSPRLMADGRVRVRLWAEAEDFSVHSARGVNVRLACDSADDSQQPSVCHLPYTGLDSVQDCRESRIWPQEFWLHDLVLPMPLNDRLLLSLEMPTTDSKLPSHESVVLDWQSLPWLHRAARSHTDNAGALTLLLGSCLYPGLPFERARSFAAFHAMRQQIIDAADHGRAADGLILLGDQIYADATADLFDPRAYYERYRNPYRLAFNQPDVAYVLSHLPTWFVVDDHEYRDNWRGLSDLNRKQDYEYARRMAGLYQMHQDEHWHLGRARLWYDVRCAGYPVFVFDTRTERHFDASAPSQLLDPSQIQGFETWLRSCQESVLIIASGSPLAPVSRAILDSPALAQADDSLVAYPRFLAAVTSALAQHAAGKKIIWLSGDPHLSCVAVLELSSEHYTVPLIQICCSGLNAPLPFVNARPADYDWDTRFDLRLRAHASDVTIRGVQHLLTDHTQHFVRMDIDASQHFRVTVQAYDAASARVGQPFSSDWAHVSASCGDCVTEG